MNRHPVATKSWQKITGDLIGPLPRSVQSYRLLLGMFVANCFTVAEGIMFYVLKPRDILCQIIISLSFYV